MGGNIMVTLKRKVKTDSGRVGGYATNMSSSMNNYDRYQSQKEEESDVIRAEFYDDSKQYKDYLWQEFNRTTSRPILSPEQVRNGVKPEDLQKQGKYTSTYSYSGYAPAYSMPKSNTYRASSDEEQAHGITFKAKMMIVAYVAVVVFFLTLIVINAGTLASLRKDLTALEAAESTVNNQLTETVVPSAPVVEETVQMSGVESSLQNAVYAGDYTLMNVGTPQRYEGNTSWFDSVCDWLDGVIGG